jgi:hypothetical protein
MKYIKEFEKFNLKKIWYGEGTYYQSLVRTKILEFAKEVFKDSFVNPYGRYYSPDSKKLEGHSDKILIHMPSQTYFKSVIRFQIIFVDSVFKHKLIYGDDKFEFQVIGEHVITCKSDDEIDFTHGWDQTYNEDGFERLKFIEVKDLYDKHTDVFIGLLEQALEDDKDNKYGEWFKLRIKNIISKMTIPETEHIVSANKYNL